MNLRIMGVAFLALSCAATLSYAFSIQGVSGKLIDSPWKLAAAVVGFSIAAGVAHPYLRGIRSGDALVTSLSRRHPSAGGLLAFTESVCVTALESGFKGKRIRVRLPDGRKGEGVITAYAGTISPAALDLTDTEA
ncbi:TPA: hypothetical protein HA318_04700 [Candidatus Micrarchaeota archaeon]|nr:hypothetical protein [Candidatus Micrarchaeota archaeon]